MSFKWSEEEINNVAGEMYKLMTQGNSSCIDYWSAFKMAQSKVNTKYKYSLNFQNTLLMKELRKRINNLFCKKTTKPNLTIIDKLNTVDILKKITDRGEEHHIISPSVELKVGYRTLLTGNVVESLDHEVEIVIKTSCPKKWVLVDLETGDQYSSLGINRASGYQAFVNPVRRIVIPKPKKEVK